LPVEETKEPGLSNAEIEFIRKKTTVYRDQISEPGRLATR
jgi:hypothetical protein